MISKLLETIENLSSNKNYNNFNTATTNNSCNNDSEITRSKNKHLVPPQWDILSTTSDTTTNSDNGRLINLIPSISIEEQLREVRLQKYAQFKIYQRLLSEKKTLEEKPDTYPPNTCVLLGNPILNGVIEMINQLRLECSLELLSTTYDMHYLSSKSSQKSLIIHARTNDAVKFTSRDILNKLLQLKSFIQEKLPDAEITISTPTLRSDNGKAVRQLTNHLINLKIDILDKRNIAGKQLRRTGLHLNQSGSNLTPKTLFLSC